RGRLPRGQGPDASRALLCGHACRERACACGRYIMSALKLITDGYDRKARLYPALVCLAPLVVTGMAIFSAKLSAVQSIAASHVGCGGAFPLSQLARDAGKKGEKALFARWGGVPPIAIFRHCDTRLDAITKVRYHKFVKCSKAPSVGDEQADPTAADQTYAA